MGRVYVVMKAKDSPVWLSPDIPHEVFSNRKDAETRANDLNSRAITNTYWVESVINKIK